MVELAEIASTLDSLPTVLRALLTPLDEAATEVRPEPGEWCVKEVIGHLIATDTGAFADRIASVIAGEPEIAGFDPWAAIRARDFTATSLDDLIDELESVRSRSVAYVRSLDPTELSATAGYPGFGRFAAGDFLYEWPFHDQEHVRQILAALQPRYLEPMTATMRDALTSS